MTTTTTTLKGFESREEMEDFMVAEVKKASRKASFNQGIDQQDVESYLMLRVWVHVTKNPKYQTEAGVRQVIKSRVINFLNSPTNHHSDVDVFSSMSSTDDEGSESSFEVPFNAHIEDSVILGNRGEEFMATLSDKHRNVVELRLDGFDIKEIASIVFPELSYESARKAVRRQLQQIAKLAKEFGLGE